MRFCEGVLNNYKYTQHTIKNLERYGASMNYRLSESEEQIMSFLWENKGPVKTGMIMDYFWKTVGKDWKRQTGPELDARPGNQKRGGAANDTGSHRGG